MNTRESYYITVLRQDVDRLKKQGLEQNKPLKKECSIFFYIDPKQKHGVNQSHWVFCLFVCFLQAALQPLNPFFFLLLSTRDMSPSPTALCPWWICGDLFGFYTKSTTDCFTKLQTFLEGNTHFTFWTVLYWAKAGHRFTMYFRFLLFSKGTTL